MTLVDPGRLKEASRLGPGGAYYLSLHFSRLGMDDRAALLCDIEWNSKGGPARIEAGRALMRYARASRNWNEALSRSEKFVKRVPADAEALYLKLESLVRLGQWDKALRINAARLPSDYGARRSALVSACLAAASLRAKAKGAEEAVDALIREERDAEALILLSDLLGAASAESPPSLLRARRYVAQREYGLACADFALFPGLFSEPSGRALVSDAGRAWLNAGKAAEGAQLLASLDGKLDGRQAGQKAMARLWAGRCLLTLKKAAEARIWFRACLEIAGRGQEFDAAAWFLIDSAAGLKDAIDVVASTASFWNDSAYFDDVLDKLLRDCLASGGYAELERLSRSLSEGKASFAMRRRIRYVLDRARSLGLYKAKEQDGAPPSAAERTDDYSYFAIMEAAFLSGPEPGIADIERAAPSQPAISGKPKNPAKPAEEEAFIRGFIDYGLPEEAAAAASMRINALSPEFLRASAIFLFQAGHPLPCARFMALLAATPGYVRDRADLEIVYPRPWRAEVGEVAAEFGLSENLLYALARTESSFDPLAQSRAGAYGLTQLMPETARETAAKLRINEPDLGDPAVNLRLGGSYLSGLIRYFSGDVAKALMSYNGGMGRVRAWAKENPGLPSDLLVEIAPLPETREYLRKVLAALAVYGYLYESRPMSGAAFFAYGALSGPGAP